MSRSVSDQKIEDILVRKGAISAPALQAAWTLASERGVRIEKYLVDEKLVPPESVALALAEYLNLTPINLTGFVCDQTLLDLVPKETMLQHLLVPLARNGNMLTVAQGDPFDVMGLDELHAMTGLTVMAVTAPESQVMEILQKFTTDSAQGLEDILKDVSDAEEVELGKVEQEEASLDEMLESAEDAPVVRIVNSIMVEAIRKKASDIHIEPMEKSIRLRYRVDGMLHESPSPPKNLQSALISRLKIMSHLDIAERRVPQDGRFKIKALGKDADIRVSMLPTVHGEKIVMRILDKTALAGSLDALGLDEGAYRDLKYAVTQPHGMLLVTGPTGSGKTTTLYSALQELNQPDVNIITVEDPVEYQLQGINQVQANADVGLSFAAGLRSILRQDPDVVMIGEIRDSETANIAVQAALTGHLVLSTLHTNDASGAIARLAYMGVEPFLIASSLVMAQAQRLFRRLCPACRQPRELPLEVLKNNHIDPAVFKSAALYMEKGCPKCSQMGYRGRGALMEILLMNDEIRAMTLKSANASDIREIAVRHGMQTLRDVGLAKAANGVTSIEEVIRITTGH